MKKIIILLSICFLSVPCFSNKVYAYENVEKCVVMELNSLRILYEENAYKKAYPASTTKILTAICVIENCNLSEKVTIKKQFTGIEGSSIYLEEGEILTVEELLYGLMLRSGNDCAMVLADFAGKGIDNFVKIMNDTAKKAGAENSNFVNPHGLHDDNHYVTAVDLAKITAYALKNETFKKIVSTQKITISGPNNEYSRVLVNKNKMLKEFEGSTGVKTGYTKKAGRCLVSSCNRENDEYICVVLNCVPMFEKSKNLLNDTYNNYVRHNLVESDNILTFIPTTNGEKIGVYIKNDIVLPLTDDEYRKTNICYEIPEILSDNVKKDEEIGFVKIYIENNLIFSEKIYTINGVKNI